MSPGSQETANRSRWMRAGRPYAQWLIEQPQWGRQLWEPIHAAVLQQPADLVHLSNPRLPALVFGVLYKRLCQGLPEPRERMGPLWTRLAVDLAQRFDGITVANRPLQRA
jgi:hypothetical protein